jgi:hypothetical protein
MIAKALSAVTLLLGLVACSSTGQSTASSSVASSRPPVASTPAAVTTMVIPSGSCRHAMEVAAAEPDPAKADPLIRASLDACLSADEWLAALKEYPKAMGLATTADIGDRDLQAACYGSERRAVCVDAQAGGRL